MPALPRITGLKQSVTWTATLQWPSNEPVIELNPEQHRAFIQIRQFAEKTKDDESALMFVGSKILDTLSDKTGDIKIFADHVTLTIPDTKSRKWKLQALEDSITRTVNNETDPPTVDLVYPKQLLHGTLLILKQDGSPSAIPSIDLELEMETSANYG